MDLIMACDGWQMQHLSQHQKLSPSFCKKNRIAVDTDILTAPIISTVKDLFALQGAQLWNHGNLLEEDLAEDSDFWGNVQKDQSDPPLNLHQIRMLKAEFRVLVPSIHEVIDRAHANSAIRRQKKDAIEAKRKALLQKVIGRMSAETKSDAFLSWKQSVGNSSRVFKTKMRALSGSEIMRLTTGDDPEPAESLVMPCDHVVLNVGRSISPISLSKSDKMSADHLLRTDSEKDALGKASYQLTFSSDQSFAGNDCVPYSYENSPARHYSPFSDHRYTSNTAPVIYVQQNPSAPFFLAGQPAAYMPY
mmetsp:Transcript_50506/g.105497  ORF Transcript_50506/g.105497 Transcript_50506/m.105497 type:complete len:305 (+) Transcript_50506:2318-3232(+)